MAEYDCWQTIFDYCSDSQFPIAPLESDARGSDLIDIASLSEDINVVNSFFGDKEFVGGCSDSNSISSLCRSTQLLDPICKASNSPEWDICNWNTIPIPATSLALEAPNGNPALRCNDLSLTDNNKCSPDRLPPTVTTHLTFTSSQHVPGTLSTCDPCSNNIDGEDTHKVEDGQADCLYSVEDMPDSFIHWEALCGFAPVANNESDDEKKDVGSQPETSSYRGTSCGFVMEGVRDSSIDSISPLSSSNLALISFNKNPIGSSDSMCTVHEREKVTVTHQHGSASMNRVTDISMHELFQYFNMPIAQAAKELKVGLTVLKKKCREFGIPRWPYRKMKSLQSLINNIQELGQSNGGLNNGRLRNAVQILEEQKKLMQEMPGIQLAERTKRLRQACFKANYKKRRQMAIESVTVCTPKPAAHSI